MATTIFMEGGFDGTGGSGGASTLWTIGGTVIGAAGVGQTGARAIKLQTLSPSTLASISRASLLADAGRRISFRVNFDSYPTSTGAFLYCLTAASGVVLEVDMGTTGKLRIGTAAGGPVGSFGSTVLNLNTWYRITFSYVITNTTTYTIILYINGKAEVFLLSGAGTLAATTTSQLRIQIPTQWAANSNMFVDDVFIDNGTDSGDPGNIIVTNKRPVSAGAANAFTTQIGSGGSGYGSGHAPQVNEFPISTTNGWSIASASALTEEYTIEAASVGDVDVSNPRFQLVDYMGWIYCKTATAGTRNIVLAGSASNITTTTSAALYIKIGGSTTYPSTNTAIGMNNNSVNNLTSLYDCGILLAYKLPRRVSIS